MIGTLINVVAILLGTALGTLISAGYLIKTDYEPTLGISFAHYHPSLDP